MSEEITDTEPVNREVKIGDRRYEVQPFTARKVFRAAKLVGKLDKVNRKVAKEVAAYRREHREENAVMVTRAMSGAPPWNQVLGDVTAEEWERVGGEIEMREDPTPDQLMLVGLGAAIDLAEEEVFRLIALVVMPNSEFGDAARGGGAIEQKLDEYAEHFMDEPLGDFIDLAATTVDVLQEELQGKVPKVRKLRGVFSRGLLNSDKPTDDQDQPADSSEKKSTSSTASEAPTDGATQSASTESPSASPAG